ncbi:MAG: hypothetical protein K6U11_13900 [bacterium]|nr:hypothetical protein [bacterium]
MNKLEAVQTQISKLTRGEQFATREEIPCLADILWDEEIIENMLEASDENGFSRGMVILTNQRLITILKVYLTCESKLSIRKKCLIEVNEFPYREIFDIYPRGFGKITIESSRHGRNFSFILKDRTQDRILCDYLDSKLLCHQAK